MTRSALDMITAYIMDEFGEWRLETVEDEKLDTGKNDPFTLDLDSIDFFGNEDTPCKSE